jgi:acyl carrier protein
MEVKDILQKLSIIFKQVFQNNELEITYETTTHDITEWDSFSNIELILNIENAFDIKFDLRELSSIKNVGELSEYILSRKI